MMHMGSDHGRWESSTDLDRAKLVSGSMGCASVLSIGSSINCDLMQQSASSTDSFFTITSQSMVFQDGIYEGDWFRTKSTVTNHFGAHRPQCFEYCVPPEIGWGFNKRQIQLCHKPLPTSQYFGPVHGEPEHFCGYVTVCVPSHVIDDRLCWINVSKGKVAFADKVTAHELQQWYQWGWQNHYLSSEDYDVYFHDNDVPART